MTLDMLKSLLVAQPTSSDQQSALEFLERADFLLPLTRGGVPSELLRTYRSRKEHLDRTGIPNRGFPELLSSLQVLKDTDDVGVAGLNTPEWFGVFFLHEGSLLGFALVKRRSPEEEWAGGDWFRQHLT